MTALALALSYARLAEQNATLRLLRADHAPVIAAVLATHLGAPSSRMAAEEFHELVEADLEVLRDHVPLPNTARAYCDAWRRAGYLTRRPAVQSRGETYELSPEGHVAIRMFAQLNTPRSTVTQSRLMSLAQAVRQLSIDTDPDATRRLSALRAERDRLDTEIAKINSGEVDVLSVRESTERVNDILLQAQDLPADFAGVRARFEQLNHDLRSSILDADAGQGSVLDDVFRGVDVIESSDEGMTFTAFSSLIRDPEQSSAFESDLSSVLEREFSQELSLDARRALRGLVRDLKNGSREVHGVLTEFARGLRRYVVSQEFQRDRALRDTLHSALAAALPASRRVKPYAALDVNLELTSVRMTTVGELNPHDPTDFDTGTPLGDAESGVVDLAVLAEIARESEIDFAELIDNVNAVLELGTPASVATVLAHRPATQGLASIVGLLSLSLSHGEVLDGVERLMWAGADGKNRAADVSVHLFTRRIA